MSPMPPPPVTVDQDEETKALEAFLESEKRPMLANLRIIIKDCKRDIKRDRGLYVDGGHDKPSIDIRLCVDERGYNGAKADDWTWIFRIGSVDYDNYHSDYCAASCIGLDCDAETLLEELTKQIGE